MIDTANAIKTANSIKKVAVFTATRAEYGLLYWLMKDIDSHHQLQLQLMVSGTHLSKIHGHTIDQIVQDGFTIDGTIDLNLSEQDQRIDVAHAMSAATKGVADLLSELNPDVFILLGDRYELLGAASAALIMGVPIFHLHGGEITEGAYDDSIRHAVTKMATWHGVANQEYRQRVIQMGEPADAVFNVGAMGLDNIKRLSLLSKTELEEKLGFKFGKKTILVTFHPVTNAEDPLEGFRELLSILHKREDISVIFTHPNADHGRMEIVELITDFVENHSSRSKDWISLGQINFLSSLQYVNAIVGNSSSGILEAPSFAIPTVNIGTRQQGRIRAKSIIDCDSSIESIDKAISHAFKTSYANTKNPFGEGNASAKLISLLESLSLKP